MQLDPTDVSDYQRFMDYERHVTGSRLFGQTVKRIERPGMTVCDVGGASGVFLNELMAQASHPIEPSLVEVAGEYRDRLVNPDIEFIQASIVDSGLASDRFDLVTARHVLHHLVGDTVSETQALQRRALAEMVRITAPGGMLLFEEQVNRVRPFSRAVYYLSRFANRRRLRVKYFEAGNVVVSFMTPDEIQREVTRIGRGVALDVVQREYIPWDMGLRWKLTILMADVGSVFYAIRKAG